MKKITVFLTIALLLLSTPTFAWEGSIWVRMLSFSDAFEVAWQQGPRPINRIMHTQGSPQNSTAAEPESPGDPPDQGPETSFNDGPGMVDGNDNYN